MTFTVPIPSPFPRSHSHSHDNALYPFPFTPDTAIPDSIPIQYVLFEIMQTKKMYTIKQTLPSYIHHQHVNFTCLLLEKHYKPKQITKRIWSNHTSALRCQLFLTTYLSCFTIILGIFTHPIEMYVTPIPAAPFPFQSHSHFKPYEYSHSHGTFNSHSHL